MTWDDEVRFTVSFPTVEERGPGYLVFYDGAMDVRRGAVGPKKWRGGANHAPATVRLQRPHNEAVRREHVVPQ